MAQEFAAVQVDKLIKRYGPRTILDGISFSLTKGQFLSVIGPNGVGKTTLIKVIAGITRPNKGNVYIDGYSTLKSGVKARSAIGVLSHNTYLYKDLSPYENLRFYAKLYKLDSIEERIDKVLEKVELADRKKDIVRTFSRGMEQRLGIARAMLHDPQTLILDEPYSGLDPRAAELLDKTIAELKKEGKTFLMTSHDLNKACEISDRVIALGRQGIEVDAASCDIKPEELISVYEGAPTS